MSRKWTIVFVGLILSASPGQTQPGKIPLQANWQFTPADTTDWMPATVPGTVHTDLLANKRIADPFFSDQEKTVQWVEQKDWIYQASFDVPAAVFRQPDARLVFEGLDTHVSVFLNGQLLFRANNMFRTWRIPVRHLLRKGRNHLRLEFQSSVRHDDSLAAMSPLRLAGENSRMYSRKAQYQYGWDWGPRLVTCGIWKPVYWETAPPPDRSRSAAFPAVSLVQEPDSAGRSFYFRIGNKPVYMKGANWIPCESFLPRALREKRYERLLRQAKEAGINMLRVWGGGVYEDDLFYRLCERYGIWVWQDFMFAGALYPSDSAFLENAEAEIREQVTRLRQYRCIVLWCGNNEIEEAWHNWGWQKQYGYSASDSLRLWEGYRELFHRRIPRILAELDPQRPYWPSSPSLGWGREAAYRQGDVHYWGVWWGREPVEKYREKTGRFNSEYGMQSLPDYHTLAAITRPEERDTSSAAMKTHQKHPFGYANIRAYILHRFPEPAGLEELVYVSQLMQSDAMATAIEAHRGKRPYNMGTLFWQWNDCWPVVSWSAVDYAGRKKALAWHLKRLFATFLVSIRTESRGSSLVVVSDSGQGVNVSVRIRGWDLRSNRALGAPVWIRQLHLPPAQATTLDLALPASWLTVPEDARALEIQVLSGNLVLASSYHFFSAPKDLRLSAPGLSWRRVGRDQLVLRAGGFAYGVQVDAGPDAEISDNFFHLAPEEEKRLTVTGADADWHRRIRIRSLYDINR